MVKKVLYFIPTIILTLFLIFYIPLFRLVSNITMHSSKMVSSGSINNRMLIITLIVVIVSIIIKTIFNSKRCEIAKSISVLNTIIFILLCIGLFIMKVFCTVM